MATSITSSKVQRRSEDARAAILAATRDELVESGWRKFSVDKVAKRAKASKQTIYRWWPAIGNMCMDAAFELVTERTKTGRDPVERIAELLHPVENAIKQGSGHAVMRGAIMAGSDDTAAGETLRAWLKENIRMPLRMILAEIASKKVVRRDFDLDAAMDILTGPIWTRILIMRGPLPDQFSETQAKALLTHLAP